MSITKCQNKTTGIQFWRQTLSDIACLMDPGCITVRISLPGPSSVACSSLQCFSVGYPVTEDRCMWLGGMGWLPLQDWLRMVKPFSKGSLSTEQPHSWQPLRGHNGTDMERPSVGSLGAVTLAGCPVLPENNCSSFLFLKSWRELFIGDHYSTLKKLILCVNFHNRHSYYAFD